MLYWIQILPPIGGATSMDFFATHIACLIAALLPQFYIGVARMENVRGLFWNTSAPMHAHSLS